MALTTAVTVVMFLTKEATQLGLSQTKNDSLGETGEALACQLIGKQVGSRSQK